MTQLAMDSLPPDLTARERRIYEQVRPCTMTSPERVVAAIRAADYIATNGIAGDIVECGVWRGGSSMAIALALLEAGDTERSFFLYDTFAGMTEPTEHDVQFDGTPAGEILMRSAKDCDVWGIASLQDTRQNLESTRYPRERFHFVAGPVEETIPRTVPDRIALLRLDTDWYASTLHELQHLYPLLSPRGILIIDDYGHWRGAKQAADEFFARLSPRPFLARIDYTAVLTVKLP